MDQQDVLGVSIVCQLATVEGSVQRGKTVNSVNVFQPQAGQIAERSVETEKFCFVWWAAISQNLGSRTCKPNSSDWVANRQVI